MEWRDEGLIIGIKKHGETSVILEAMTRAHGRHLGLVKGGRSKRMQPLLQVGNNAEFVWRARLDEHLGFYAVEPTQLRTARLMASPQALHAMNLISALLRLVAEREPHPALYETVMLIVDHLDEPEIAPALLVRFEATILAETGFGLDLDSCAATGAREDLVYVSPKSGRAVSREAGAPYRERLLPLPAFLRGGHLHESPLPGEIRAGFRLTEYFLARDLFGPRGLSLPQARSAYLAEIEKVLKLFPPHVGHVDRESDPVL
jgi:DNA repair protein RecO (recombination protein O)